MATGRRDRWTAPSYVAMTVDGLVVAQGSGEARLQRSTGRIVVRAADGTLRDAGGGPALGVELAPDTIDWDLLTGTEAVVAATPQGVERHDGQRIRLLVRTTRVVSVWADHYLPYVWVVTWGSKFHRLSCLDLEGRRVGPRVWVVSPPHLTPLGFLRPEDRHSLALLSARTGN
ncbi:MAG: hypothetical protein HUU26_03775 [Gemmatimonadaceae bacterium]|nr:hypothetical protein [Gemmatimonadaceae bacterium]